MRRPSFAGAFRAQIDAMRNERVATAAATRAERHAEALARARAKDEARCAKRNEDTDPAIRDFLDSIPPKVRP
jgi:hypothetical protein